MEPYTRLRKRLSALIGSLLLAGVMGIIVIQVTQGVQATQLATATPTATEVPRREISDDVESPAISFIDSASATCSRPVEGTGACFIEWNYLNVTAASGSYIISMTVAIDNRIRAYHAGFFQTSMYIPGNMTAPGYKVTCGKPGSGGQPDWGKTYSYIIRARETTGLSAANYGSVTCPADTVRVFLPFVTKN